MKLSFCTFLFSLFLSLVFLSCSFLFPRPVRHSSIHQPTPLHPNYYPTATESIVCIILIPSPAALANKLICTDRQKGWLKQTALFGSHQNAQRTITNIQLTHLQGMEKKQNNCVATSSMYFFNSTNKFVLFKLSE